MNTDDQEKILQTGQRCVHTRADYFECLHGKKERARVLQILEEERKQKQGGDSSGGDHH